MLGLRKILVPKNSQSQKVCVQRIVSSKNVWSETLIGPKYLALEQFGVQQKNLSPNIILVQKHYLSKEKIRIFFKNFSCKENFVKNISEENCHRDKCCKDKCPFDNCNLSEMVP